MPLLPIAMNLICLTHFKVLHVSLTSHVTWLYPSKSANLWTDSIKHSYIESLISTVRTNFIPLFSFDINVITVFQTALSSASLSSQNIVVWFYNLQQNLRCFLGFILFFCWSFSNLIANSDAFAMSLPISFVTYGFLIAHKRFVFF